VNILGNQSPFIKWIRLNNTPPLNKTSLRMIFLKEAEAYFGSDSNIDENRRLVP
jgi:hypothetical protein